MHRHGVGIDAPNTRAAITLLPETIDVELARYPSIENLRTEMQRAGFQHLSENVAEWAYEGVDTTPFREKVFSSLLYISQEAFENGLIELEGALAGGVVPLCVEIPPSLGHQIDWSLTDSCKLALSVDQLAFPVQQHW